MRNKPVPQHIFGSTVNHKFYCLVHVSILKTKSFCLFPDSLKKYHIDMENVFFCCKHWPGSFQKSGIEKTSELFYLQDTCL